jgi:hypothetical protein
LCKQQQPKQAFAGRRDSQRRFSRRLSSTDVLASVERSLESAALHALQGGDAAAASP